MIRDDAESSLCGIPRSSLINGGMFDQFICSDCMEWFDRRRAVSAAQRKVQQP